MNFGRFSICFSAQLLARYRPIKNEMTDAISMLTCTDGEMQTTNKEYVSSKSEHSPDGIKRRMNGEERRVILTTETKDPHHTPKRKPDAKFKGVAGRMRTTTTVLENAKFRKGLRKHIHSDKVGL